MGRKWPRHALAAVGLLALAWGSYRAAAGWWYRAELSRAQREVAAGRSGPARERLARLSASWPGEAEVHYELGLCERAAGRPDRRWRPGPGSRPGRPSPRRRTATATSCSGISSTAASSRPWRAPRGGPTRRRRGCRRGGGGPRPAPPLRGAIRRGEAPAPGRMGPGRGPVPHAARTSDARRRAGPDRDGPGRPRRGGGPGPRRRPGLAREGEPGDLDGAIRGGGPVAVGLPPAPADRPGRLARPARLGARHRASRRRRAGPRAVAGRPARPGRGPRTARLVRRPPGRPRGRAPRPGTPDRTGPRRLPGPGTARDPRRRGRPGGPRRRTPQAEGPCRSGQGALPQAPRDRRQDRQPADRRPAGRDVGALVRGPRWWSLDAPPRAR